MNPVLSGRTAIVTGAGRGIGAAIAHRLAAMGAVVVVNDLDAEPARSVAQEIERLGGSATPMEGDVSSPEEAASVVGAAADLGGLDILVNNAGVTRDAMVHKMSDDDWDLVIDACLRSTFNLCRAAYPLLKGPLLKGPLLKADRSAPPEHHRKVVNVASISGVYGSAANANYTAAKAGVIGLTKALAREWGGHRINVNAIAPGYIAGTRLTALKDDERRIGIAPDVRDRIERTIPLGRAGTPDDIAGVAAFLASPDSDYVTGQVIEAHGGLEIIPVLG